MIYQDQKIAELMEANARLRVELEMAQSACTAWQSVFEGIEAHLLDRIAMRDAANPATYLNIVRDSVANVKRDSEQIVAARWADYARLTARIAALEAEQKRTEIPPEPAR